MENKMKTKIKELIKQEYKFIIFLLVVVALFYIRLPYYINAPGGTINITNRVEMEGYENKEGSLNMLYVSEYEATPATLLWSKLFGYDIDSSKDRQISNENMLLNREIERRTASNDC